MRLSFTKMHGLGNDFIVIDHRGEAPNSAAIQMITPNLAEKICDRRFGIGADQILWLKKPQDASNAETRMEILNADGSTAEMCGNGIRAVALYLKDNPIPELPSKAHYKIETLAGIKIVAIDRDQEGRDQVTVDMGQPQLLGGFPQEGESLHVLGTELRFFEVNMGNPHAVVFIQQANVLPHGCTIEQMGPAIENHIRFPKRTNVEFVHVEGPQTIHVKVWERGAGVTLACGTGACASAVATLATGRARGPLQVKLPGGDLTIDWRPGRPVMMKGPAETVFQGEIQI